MPRRSRRWRADGSLEPVAHGRNLHLRVRPEAPVQLLFTGHMDTVFGADHPFQKVFWREEGVLGGPGVADMKGGIAVMLAALQAVEASPRADRLGYEVVINSDEEVGSPGSAALIAEAARGKQAALTYEPSALARRHAGRRAAGQRQFLDPSIEGRSAHAGRNPEEGRNAVARRRRPGAAARRGEGRPGSRSIRRGSTAAGPNNVVPDQAVLRVNMRPATPEDAGARAGAARRGRGGGRGRA